LPSFVETPTSSALSRRLAKYRDLPRSPAAVFFRERVRAIVIEGNRAGLLAGTDKQGRPLAPLAPSTLRDRKGTGPPLVPRGEASRFISGFRAEWIEEAGGYVLHCGWAGLDSRDGRPFAGYHLTGAGRLPKRDVGGIRPSDWQKIIKEDQAFLDKIVSSRGSA
jgi:hypothetical protein